MTQKIVLASSNAGKIAEIKELLKDLPITLVTLDELGISSPEETGTTFVENAIIKARHAAQHSGLPAIADDSGLVVDALGGGPGVHTARFGGEDATPEQRVAKLVEVMNKEEDRTVAFYCTVVLMANEHDPAPIICQGFWEGEVLEAPQGANGFGYDPIFYVQEHDCSAAELPAEVKNQISHRGQALALLAEALKGYFAQIDA